LPRTDAYMKILLTGASGFVGSSLMAWAAANHPEVAIHGIGRRPMPFANYSQHDLTLPFDDGETPDVVIHAAARSLPWGSAAEFERQNVVATRNILEFCERRGVGTFIYISSSSVFYREEDQELLSEQSPIGPSFVNHYARTKFEGECLARKFSGRSVILRPRAVFGPGDTVLFPRILQAAQAGKMYRLDRGGAPSARGDLIYIDSLCDYILRAALDPQIEGDFNLTNNEPIEIESFLGEVFHQLGIRFPEKRLSCSKALFIATGIEWIYKLFLPHNEPPITRFGISVLAYTKTFDVSKSLQVLGPPKVDLTTGVEAFVAWQRANMSNL
jgi:nucleoside-diphosphate-sugar epimerase